MDGLPKGLQDLIDYFARLPGVGKKTASRLAFSLLSKTPEYHKQFGNTLTELSSSLSKCEMCFHLCDSQKPQCDICTSPKRKNETLCIVETSLDLLSLERSQSYTGKYFVLGGVISPMDGIGPSDIHLQELINTVIHSDNVEEIIVALSSTMEGEATTMYISTMLEKKGFTGQITRIARGIPLGSSLQYTDENTLFRAFEGRVGV